MNVFDEKQKFLNEESGRNDKQKILKYLCGKNIVEVGCGSGINLNLIESNYNCNLTGIDISDRVINTLKLKKEIQRHSWNVFKGNGLYLNQYFKENSIDTLIFCSVIHELFSYTEWQNKKFNYDTIRYIFSIAYQILKPNGRIIIRDGIM
ncbi:methyltransferase domain-containing protein [Clostridium sp. MT-14]|uniref:methyltransferase domain-containing protein n=1 Tax=Clostridium sp. MT-14 TaxID=3348360 RepID=UPI0035F2C192